YALGDVAAGARTVAKAGIFAESAARVVAADIAARLRDSDPPPPYEGDGDCYVEFGDELVGKAPRARSRSRPRRGSGPRRELRPRRRSRASLSRIPPGVRAESWPRSAGARSSRRSGPPFPSCSTSRHRLATDSPGASAGARLATSAWRRQNAIKHVSTVSVP